MYIQYVGFDGKAGSRVYAFHVIEVAHEAREFTVEVETAAFGPSQLRFQDGPDICFALLKKALQDETEDVRTAGRLFVSVQDVRAYLETHRPPKMTGRGKRERAAAEAAEATMSSPSPARTSA